MLPNRPWAAWSSGILICVFVMLLATVYERARPMSVDIMAMNDPQRIGMVTELTLRVHNSDSISQRPTFTVLSSFPFPVKWPVVGGPQKLPPGAVAEYTIESPTGAAIPTGDMIVARVNDVGSHAFGASTPILASLKDTPALTNARFDKWTFDFATGEPAPLGWSAQGMSSPLGTQLRIARAMVAGRHAMMFVLNGGQAGRWEGIRVDQDIRDDKRVSRLFADGFTALVYPTFASTPGFGPQSSGLTGNIFGIQVYADGRLLWIVFSNGDPSWTVDRDTAVTMVHTPLGQWSSIRIDLKKWYRRLGWSEPSEMVFSLFAGLAGGTSLTRWPAFGSISQ
jgi:hypothetical protein